MLGEERRREGEGRREGRRDGEREREGGCGSTSFYSFSWTLKEEQQFTMLHSLENTERSSF